MGADVIQGMSPCAARKVRLEFGRISFSSEVLEKLFCAQSSEVLTSLIELRPH